MRPEGASLHQPRERREHLRPYDDEALAARTDACVFLRGRPEPAREFAYRLHLASGWRHGPFTVIDCRSPEPALEARLFEALFDASPGGFARPAPPSPSLPGPPMPRSARETPHAPGVVQLRLVQAGTVLLQEVNRLPLAVQRALAARLTDQWGGAVRSRRRLMASSSESLFERVCRGTFDDGLYYRLNVMYFFVPGAA